MREGEGEGARGGEEEDKKISGDVINRGSLSLLVLIMLLCFAVGVSLFFGLLHENVRQLSSYLKLITLKMDFLRLQWASPWKYCGCLDDTVPSLA